MARAAMLWVPLPHISTDDVIAPTTHDYSLACWPSAVATFLISQLTTWLTRHPQTCLWRFYSIWAIVSHFQAVYVLRLGAEGAPLLNPKYYPWIQNTILSSLILSSECLYLEAPYLLLTRINSTVGVLFILYLTTRRFLSSTNFFTT